MRLAKVHSTDTARKWLHQDQASSHHIMHVVPCKSEWTQPPQSEPLSSQALTCADDYDNLCCYMYI